MPYPKDANFWLSYCIESGLQQLTSTTDRMVLQQAEAMFFHNKAPIFELLQRQSILLRRGVDIQSTCRREMKYCSLNWWS